MQLLMLLQMCYKCSLFLVLVLSKVRMGDIHEDRTIAVRQINRMIKAGYEAHKIRIINLEYGQEGRELDEVPFL